MIARCPKLQERWREATHTEITGGIKKGFRCILSDEERIRDGWVVQDMVWVYSIKRTGVLKCRAASDGSDTP
jgi:hypothetical protein